ncbi:putative enoyl-CoA hydratase [Mycobacterium kansasii 824]|nr:putative enoyl-CoA hydratase [Mycobacterium kansasii 824]
MRVLIVDSADPEFFIAHADVSLLGDLHGRPETADTALHDELSFFHAMTERIRTLPKATIAVIEGICRGGGCEFAMAFDMRFAALGTTVLGHPEVSVGIIPGGGGTQRLPGWSVAGGPWKRSWVAWTSTPRRPRPGDTSTGRCRPTNCAGSSTGSPPASPRARRRRSRPPNARWTPPWTSGWTSRPACASRISCFAKRWPNPQHADCFRRSSTPAPRPETSSGAPRRNRPRPSPGSAHRRQR